MFDADLKGHIAASASMPVPIEKITRSSARVPVPLGVSTLGKYPEEKACEEV